MSEPRDPIPKLVEFEELDMRSEVDGAWEKEGDEEQGFERCRDEGGKIIFEKGWGKRESGKPYSYEVIKERDTNGRVVGDRGQDLPIEGVQDLKHWGHDFDRNEDGRVAFEHGWWKKGKTSCAWETEHQYVELDGGARATIKHGRHTERNLGDPKEDNKTHEWIEVVERGPGDEKIIGKSFFDQRKNENWGKLRLVEDGNQFVSGILEKWGKIREAQ